MRKGSLVSVSYRAGWWRETIQVEVIDVKEGLNLSVEDTLREEMTEVIQ